MENNEFPFLPMMVVRPSRDAKKARATALNNWRAFKEGIMGLSSIGVFEAACGINKHISHVQGSVIPGIYAQKAKQVPYLMANFAFALMENERRPQPADPLEVKRVVDMALNSTLFAMAAFSDKMAARIEFQPDACSMPKDAKGIYDLALDDAVDGSTRGFNWGCSRLRQAFASPSTSLIGTEAALDLYAGLSEVPDMMLDEFGEAGLDDVVRMERHLAIIKQLPVYTA